MYDILYALKGQIIIIAALYLLALLAVAIDFVSGIRRAKREGKLRTSIGYRKSISKVNQYGMFLAILSVLDLMTTVAQILPMFGVKDLPFVTFLGCAIVCVVEARSVWENSERGRRAAITQAAKQVLDLAQSAHDRRELLEVIAEQLTKNHEEQAVRPAPHGGTNDIEC